MHCKFCKSVPESPPKTMDELPKLPFELVLSYLSFAERLRLSAVSRSCHQKIFSLRVQSLCYSERPSGFILGKSHWVSGAFAENFISSSRFISFFKAFGRSVLSNLKHLRLCDLSLDLENRTAFTRTLKSFGELEQLDIVRAKCSRAKTFKLNLQALTSIHLEDLSGIEMLTLDTPRLRKIKLVRLREPNLVRLRETNPNQTNLVNRFYWPLQLNIIHGESVERLISVQSFFEVEQELMNLKNLQVLYLADFLPNIDPNFLLSLKQLKEIHLNDRRFLSSLFQQKQRWGRTELKIYVAGLLLNGPDDPEKNIIDGFYSHTYLRREIIGYLAEISTGSKRSRLADEMLFYRDLSYTYIKSIAPGLEINLLKKFTELNEIQIHLPVRDIERFLGLLKNLENIVELVFKFFDQPQDLFDRLPEHCAVQCLAIDSRPSDLGFLFRLKNLIHLHLDRLTDVELVRRAFEELPVLSSFSFRESLDSSGYYRSSGFDRDENKVELDRSKRFSVSIFERTGSFSNLNDVVEFLLGKKRKTE